MKRVATIILNRNLPEVTERLCGFLLENSGNLTDLFIVESGSESEKLSKYCTWWANWEESMRYGLRYPRGFNFGLTKLLEEGKFKNYDYFFLVCNDTEFEEKSAIEVLISEMEKHPRVGILSPCSKRWGEYKLLQKNETKYFWYVQHISWFIRREYIESIMETEEPSYMNFLYDGTNFRGYGADIELIVKGYANDWATAITKKVLINENEELLKTKADLIKTEHYEENLVNVINEGKKWLHRKYGFNSRWTMQMYAKFMYEKFFEYFPELEVYKI